MSTPINGRFVKGNEIGKETRFKPKHTFSSKYKPEYCDLMYEYFTCPDKRESIFPTFEGFATSIHVVCSTLECWREKYPQFDTVYRTCLQIQKDNLVNGALLERYNPAFSKFLATNNFGMAEKVEQKVDADHDINIRISLFDEEDEKH